MTIRNRAQHKARIEQQNEIRNQLYLRDNLEVMRHNIPNGSVDLICTDPPFNSGVQYCTFYDKSKKKQQVFKDIWTYNEATEELRYDIEQRAKDCAIYSSVNNALKAVDLSVQRAANKPPTTGFGGAMRSYTTYMAPRLVEGYYCLADTGSILLHCDPHANYYLRMLLDAIFGPENFRNQIIWEYSKWSSRGNHFPKNHDVILYYSKSKNITFNPIFKKEMSDMQMEILKYGYRCHSLASGLRQLRIFDRNNPFAQKIIKSGKYTEDQIIYLEHKKPSKPPKQTDVWTDISSLRGNAKERLGYPTQKPLELLLRMIEFSSNEGDLILDPFMGTGTTIDAAQTLDRSWIGIDIEPLAKVPTEIRLKYRHNLVAHVDYYIDQPTTVQAVRDLDDIQDDEPTTVQEMRSKTTDTIGRHRAARFLVSLIDLHSRPKSGDGGWDGENDFQIWDKNGTVSDLKVIAEVKTGQNINWDSIRSFRSVIDDNNAAGIFITLAPVNKSMKQYAKDQETYEHNGKQYPKFQFLEVTDELLQHPERFHTAINLPPTRKPQKRPDPYVPKDNSPGIFDQ